ncbi:MAG: DUF6472 family protein [Lachnospiraceae bacterium]|nr:DUF6472 family protein [Lachnospiraceae bacterium]
MSQCESCAYYAYDEEYDAYFCEADMDEDDYSRLLTEAGIAGKSIASCSFYRDGDEYKVVRHQI